MQGMFAGFTLVYIVCPHMMCRKIPAINWGRINQARAKEENEKWQG
jgi:hypothetical protein